MLRQSFFKAENESDRVPGHSQWTRSFTRIFIYTKKCCTILRSTRLPYGISQQRSGVWCLARWCILWCKKWWGFWDQVTAFRLSIYFDPFRRSFHTKNSVLLLKQIRQQSDPSKLTQATQAIQKY